MPSVVNKEGIPIQQQFERLAQELPPLDLSGQMIVTPLIQTYINYYHLTFEGTDYRHSFGSFRSGGYTLAAHLFIPQTPRGTVFILHGYLDHTGMLRHLIRYCLQQKLVVAVYDLPGHGLSSGPRISIEDFSGYVAVFTDFVRFCQSHVPEPYYLISHSTGSAIALEYLVQAEEHPVFEQMIFLAPLVRHVHWYPAKVIYALGKMAAVETVPRRFSTISSDPGFIEFLKNDPLQTMNVPLQWIGALYEWEQHIQNISPIEHPVLIIQGTRDTVVDARYNISFLERKLVRSSVIWLDNGRHHLINETPALREEVFKTIDTYLLLTNRNSASTTFTSR